MNLHDRSKLIVENADKDNPWKGTPAGNAYTVGYLSMQVVSLQDDLKALKENLENLQSQQHWWNQQDQDEAYIRESQK